MDYDYMSDDELFVALKGSRDSGRSERFQQADYYRLFEVLVRRKKR